MTRRWLPVQPSFPVSLFVEAASELCHQSAVSAASDSVLCRQSAVSTCRLLLVVSVAVSVLCYQSVSAASDSVLCRQSAVSACQLLAAVSVSAASASQLPLPVSAASGLAFQILSLGL